MDFQNSENKITVFKDLECMLRDWGAYDDRWDIEDIKAKAASLYNLTEYQVYPSMIRAMFKIVSNMREPVDKV
jgi:hypothetical protein